MAVATRGWPPLKRSVIFLSSVIALVSYRYLFGLGAVPRTVLANAYFHGWALVHATSAATALLIGPFQFMARLRQSRPTVHRVTGVIYVSACLAGGVSALPLALGSAAGHVASAGFLALGTAWMATTAIAVQRIAAGKIADHGRWMARSFALTLSALTLRVDLFVSGMLGMDYFVAYPIIAWACWLPNMLVLEWYLGFCLQPETASNSHGSP